MHLSENSVMVYIEQREGTVQKVSLELLGAGKKLADELGVELVAVIIGHRIQGSAEYLIHYGADRVLVLEDQILDLYVTEPYTQALIQGIKHVEPEIVLIGATTIGRDLAPRVSARIKTGLTADCTKLEIGDDNQLWMTRPAFGGNIMATIVCPDHRPQMSTVRPGVMMTNEKDTNRLGRIEVLDIKLTGDAMNIEVLEVVKVEKEKMCISEAKVLVSGGRGVGTVENYGNIEALAGALEGAVSGSRAAVDAGWISHDQQVGQTGQTVRPDVYFACGISGAIQHVAGMEESELIIAINKDPGAQIFETADLGIVGDMHKVLPHLVQEIRQIRDKEDSA